MAFPSQGNNGTTSEHQGNKGTNMATALIVHLDIRPEDFDRFVEIARAHGEYSVANEEGCVSFQVMLPVDEKDKVILVEVYDDNGALESHWNSEHMQAYLEKTKDMIVRRQRYQCRV
jgi:autoinducer 2-degrading protein